MKRNSLFALILLLVSGVAYSQDAGPDFRSRQQAARDLDMTYDEFRDGMRSKPKPELIRYSATEVQYKNQKVTKATIKDGNKIICQIDNPEQHPTHENVVYQQCNDDVVVSVYYDHEWIDEFHFQFYQVGESTPFAESWINVSKCKCLDPKPIREVDLSHENPGLRKRGEY